MSQQPSSLNANAGRRRRLISRGKLPTAAVPLFAASFVLAVGLMPLRAADETTPGEAPVTQITSQTVDFDLKTRQAVYHGDVHVADPRITLTCEMLRATLAEAGGRVESLIAETNVVALIATNDTVYTVKSAQATYTYKVTAAATNQTLELSGEPDPKITWPQAGSDPVLTNEFTARRIFWDIGNDTINAEQHRGVFPNFSASRKPAASAPEATNSPTIAPTPPTSNP
jgi:lipopolysaccharide export system protein LptA